MSFVRQKMDGSATLVIHAADPTASASSAAASSGSRPDSAYRPASGSRPSSASRPGSASRPRHGIAHPLAALVGLGLGPSEYKNDPVGDAVSHGSYAGRAMRRVDSDSGGMSRALDMPTASDKRPPSDFRRRAGNLQSDDDVLNSVVAVQSVDEEQEAADDSEQAASGAAADEWPSVLADGWRAYWLRTLHDVFLTSWLNVLLVCIPIAVIVYYARTPAPVIFIFALLGLVPLAERIAFVTDELAKYTSDTFGGLISASMGNVTELIVAIVAITEGGSLLLVTQLSLVGSIVSNLLLVLGCAFLAGGYKQPHQRYSKPAVNANIGLLLLSTMVIILPTIMTVTRNYNCNHTARTHALAQRSHTHWQDGTCGHSHCSSLCAACWLAGYGINGYPAYYNVNEPNMPDTPTLHFSIAISVFMLILYGFLIYYQLFTHRSLFEKQEDDEEEETPPVLGLWGAVGWALAITALIAILSELIVSSIETAASDIGVRAHLPLADVSPHDSHSS